MAWKIIVRHRPFSIGRWTEFLRYMSLQHAYRHIVVRIFWTKTFSCLFSYFLCEKSSLEKSARLWNIHAQSTEHFHWHPTETITTKNKYFLCECCYRWNLKSKVDANFRNSKFKWCRDRLRQTNDGKEPLMYGYFCGKQIERVVVQRLTTHILFPWLKNSRNLSQANSRMEKFNGKPSGTFINSRNEGNNELLTLTAYKALSIPSGDNRCEYFSFALKTLLHFRNNGMSTKMKTFFPPVSHEEIGHIHLLQRHLKDSPITQQIWAYRYAP